MDFNKYFENKQDNALLREYFHSLPRWERVYLGHKIADECKISYTVFNNWLNFLTKIPQLHKDKIEEIVGKKIFNSASV